MTSSGERNNQTGLIGATSVGVGAIVGGGILALAGTAFAVTGPSAILAFLLNGVIAMLTALSLAEMASRFPESGGTYTYSKKVLSVESAFSVGWVSSFASIVAGLLYALGLAWFLLIFVRELLGENAPPWLMDAWMTSSLAIGMTLVVGVLLSVQKSGSGNLVNIAKLLVFILIISAGLIAILRQPAGTVQEAVTPFFAAGIAGLFQAMGYTFIALQGFDLIAAIGGEIRDPKRNIPRAMVLSLIIALAIYLPLLLVVTVFGPTSGMTISEFAKSNREGIVASAASSVLGRFGYWLVIVAAILAMYSALHANIYAASRINLAMARDRTLPAFLSRASRNGNPVVAVWITVGLVCGLVILVQDVGQAGAVSSLIFLVMFAVAHWISILIRQRSLAADDAFLTPLFPAVPVVGGLACLALAIFQGIRVPAAGLIAAGWLALGTMLFLWLFASRARIRDATAAAINPELMRLRGRSPLVLVPIANPESAEPLIALAHCLVPNRYGRVLIQNVVVPPDDWDPGEDEEPIRKSQQVLQQLIKTSARLDFRVESLTTIAERPMTEIARVAMLHQCQSIVMGMSDITNDKQMKRLERLMGVVAADVVIVRAKTNWTLTPQTRVLVPVAGPGGNEYLMAQVLGSLSRQAKRDVTYAHVVPPNATADRISRARRMLQQLAEDQLLPGAEIEVLQHTDPVTAISDQADRFDLIVLGATRSERKEKLVGEFAKNIARRTDCTVLILGSRQL